MIISAAIFALLLGAFIFMVLPRAGLARRTLSVGIFVVLIALVYGGSVELLGRPKPMRLEWRDAAKAQVVSAVPVENEAIYVWLTMPVSWSRAPMCCRGASRRRSSFRMPWAKPGQQHQRRDGDADERRFR